LGKSSVYGAETVSIPSMYESLRAGQRVKVDPQRTIADGMQASIPGEITYEVVRKYVERLGLVNDAEMEEAIYDLLTIGRVLAEPAGASPLAAVKRPLANIPGAKTVLVVSGGNISVDLLTKILNQKAKGSS